MKVSIIISTHNRHAQLKTAVDSVLMQRYSDFELIIINDGSTDKTSDLLAQYKANDSISILTNKINIGLQASLNKGLQHATGDFIARIDDDDEWLDQDKLTKQTRYLRNNPEVVLLGTGYRTQDKEFYNPQNDAEIRKQILYRCPFQHSTIMFKRVVQGQQIFYDDQITYGEDWDLWLRLGVLGQMHNLKELTTFINTGDNMTERNFISQHADNYQMVKQYLKSYPRGTKAILYHKMVHLFFSVIPLNSFIHRFFQNIFNRVFIKTNQH